MTITEQRTPIKIVPPFMRLHEWIALEEGYFRAGGLEPEIKADRLLRACGVAFPAPASRLPLCSLGRWNGLPASVDHASKRGPRMTSTPEPALWDVALVLQEQRGGNLGP